MNQDINPLDLVARDLSQSNNPAILLPANPPLDAVYAALTLYIGLIKLGKTPSIVSPNNVAYNIKDISKISTQLGSGGDNLVISFPYTDGSIDKVDYKIENNTFNLIVIPRPGYPKVTPDQVSYSFAGGNADSLIAIGGQTPEAYGRLYQENQQLFTDLTLIVIDNKTSNTQYGSSNYVDPSAAALSQLALDVLDVMQVPLDETIGSPALNGIIAATNNFASPNIDVSVFEQVAGLMRLGAIREHAQASVTQSQKPVQQGQPQFSRQKPPPQQSQRQLQGGQQQDKRRDQQPQRNPNPQNVQQRSFNKPQQRNLAQNQNSSQNSPQSKSWADTLPNIPDQTNEKTPPEREQVDPDKQDDNNDAPQEWLKPKIFKGNGFI